MIANTLWLRLARCAAICLASMVGSIDAQSNIVFLTADVTTSSESKLVRFDDGAQSYAVDTGDSNDAFLGITILGGNVLVADFRSDTIERFSPDGTYLGNFVTPGFTPTFIESDSGGSVYATPLSPVLDEPIARRFNSSGVVTQTFTHPDMTGIEGIDADAAGNVYIIENFANQLYKFAADGTFLNRIPLGFTSPFDIAIDESGNRLYAAAQTAAAAGIKIFDISGASPSFLGSIATPPSSVIVGVHFAAESGNILATDNGVLSNDPRGLEFSSAGALLREYRPVNADQAWDIVTMVPEPSSMLLVSLAIIGFALANRISRPATSMVRLN